jgi:hypothetical protein
MATFRESWSSGANEATSVPPTNTSTRSALWTTQPMAENQRWVGDSGGRREGASGAEVFMPA